MKKKLVSMVILAFAAMLCLCGCSFSSGGATYDVYDRLDELDDFKEWAAQQPVPTQSPFAAQEYGAFRSVPYGYNRQDVMRLETLTMVEEFDNAIDFEYINIFGYDMLPTYWFNNNEQLFRGSYYTQTGENMQIIIKNLLSQLTDQYDTALETNYYDFNNDVKYFDNEQQASEAVSSGDAYFYAWYFYDEIDIEVYIEGAKKSEDDFDVFVNFTDYSYYDNN